VFGWANGGMGGISPFSGFVSINFSVLIVIYSINNVGGQHRWLSAFLAACYELTLILCFFLFNIVIVRGK